MTIIISRMVIDTVLLTVAIVVTEAAVGGTWDLGQLIELN